MTKRQRAEVVELLRCAADAIATGSHPSTALCIAEERLWSAHAEWHEAWEAEGCVRNEIGLGYLRGFEPGEDRIALLLEAAQRVEDGEWPDTPGAEGGR